MPTPPTARGGDPASAWTRSALPRLARAASAALTAVSLVTLAVSASLLGVGSGALRHVDPQAGAALVFPVAESAATVVGILASLALAAAACPGLTTRWSPPRRGAQAAGGVVVALGTWLGHAVSRALSTGYTDTPCRYDGCWPSTPQTLAAAAPTVLLGVAMVVVACLPWPWAVRRWAPVLTWVVLLGVQRALWEPVLLPLFVGPPP
ncbi:hypothetical protein Q760_07920 [Cellulomonas cellasea DSM 20118]|uniref:Uncharacterized protein n=2 Tax=Cellulomonas cellasea TaxID=43670 RepID=A0A0A0BCX2_9CELL|nr:hypothetical protein Q760_07920 [Cellulomonas cellasea DSM 20118]GEA87313.1 hypothetical protein CCE01nite_12620 [Cellulomonas cellasea]